MPSKCTSRSAPRYGNGRNNTPLTTEKIAVFVPMPNANVKIATNEKPGFFHRIRRPDRKSRATCTLCLYLVYSP